VTNTRVYLSNIICNRPPFFLHLSIATWTVYTVSNSIMIHTSTHLQNLVEDILDSDVLSPVLPHTNKFATPLPFSASLYPQLRL
jgi:hypothetical protein